MNWADALAVTLGTSGPARFPDKKLMEAAKLLRPEERPDVVQMIALDQAPEYTRTKTPEQIKALKTSVGAFVRDTEREQPFQKAYVNKDGSIYRGDQRVLAAALAHEAVHTRRKDDDEVEAYQRQHDVLKRLGFLREDPTYERNILDRIALLKQMNKDKK